MIRIWDSFLSLIAAVISVSITGLPVWATWKALSVDLVPFWFWGPMLVLGFVGLMITLSFLRKVIRGVHPLRERRR